MRQSLATMSGSAISGVDTRAWSLNVGEMEMEMACNPKVGFKILDS